MPEIPTSRLIIKLIMKVITLFVSIFVFVLFCQTSALGQTRSILCTVYPIYLITQIIASGTNLTVELLLPSQMGCPHHYILTPGDLSRIKNASLIIFNSSNYEVFLSKILKENPAIPYLDCSNAFVGQEKFLIPGNSHYFSSLLGIEKIGEYICKNLVKNFPEMKTSFEINCSNFKVKIENYRKHLLSLRCLVEGIPVVITHNSVEYGLREVGLDIVLDLNAHEADGQAFSAKSLVSMAQLIKKKGVKAIIYDSLEPPPIAVTLSRETDIPLFRWYSLTAGATFPDFLFHALRKNWLRLSEFLYLSWEDSFE